MSSATNKVSIWSTEVWILHLFLMTNWLLFSRQYIAYIISAYCFFVSCSFNNTNNTLPLPSHRTFLDLGLIQLTHSVDLIENAQFLSNIRIYLRESVCFREHALCTLKKMLSQSHVPWEKFHIFDISSQTMLDWAET